MNPMIYEDYKKKFLYNHYEKLNNPPQRGPLNSEDVIIVECKRTSNYNNPSKMGGPNKVNKCCKILNKYKEEFIKKGIDLNKIIKAENCK